MTHTIEEKYEYQDGEIVYKKIKKSRYGNVTIKEIYSDNGTRATIREEREYTY
jgi:hypothetical protein